jgi:hypothetical protein
MFKLLEGKISLYSCYPPPNELADECVHGLQLGDGPIQPFDAEALKQLIQGNPKAMQAWEKKNYIKAVNRFNNE